MPRKARAEVLAAVVPRQRARPRTAQPQRTTPPQRTPSAAPTDAGLHVRLHRGLTLAAVIGLVIGTRTVYSAYALPRPGLAVALSVGYGVMLVTAVLALTVRSTAALARVDVAVLGTAMVIKAIALWPAVLGQKVIRVDEGVLMNLATQALTAGQNPYLMSWPYLDPQAATRLMNGGGVFDFGYPPLAVQLGALVQQAGGGAVVGIVVVSGVALLATAGFVFAVAPVPLRPLVTLGVLGTGLLTGYAENAYPSLISLPLLCVAVWRWPSIGAGGRLGPGGVVRAGALGLAMSTHQLGWFLAVFLFAGLILLRRGELGGRATAAVVARYVAVAAGSALAVNAPFLVHSPAAWLRQVTEPLLQHAVPHGQGLVSITYHLIRGSGALDHYGHASILLLLALLLAFAMHIRVLGPTAPVLPWLLFLVSIRSQDGYWVLTMPLWIVALVTTTRADFARAYRLPRPPRPPRPHLQAAATAALFLPAATAVVLAAASPQPLVMRIISPVVAGRPVDWLTVEVTNRSSRTLEPNFTVATGAYTGDFWPIADGPAVVGPGSTAYFTLLPPVNPARERQWRPAIDDIAILRAVSDRPQTLSTVRFLHPPISPQ